MKRFLYPFLVLVISANLSCTKPPPNLSPTGTSAFNKTRVIKAIDLVRDTAIDANNQNPPLLSENATREIVNYHKSALLLMKASDDGWKEFVSVGLDEATKDIPPKEKEILIPYITLTKTILMEISR